MINRNPAPDAAAGSSPGDWETHTIDPTLHAGIGEAYRYYNIYERYKPLIDKAKAEYEASEELQILVKAFAPAYKAFKDSPGLMQLFATLPNIMKEIKAAHD